MTKKIAILLVGKFYDENHPHWKLDKKTKNQVYYKIDYKKSLENYQEYIFNYFKDYEIDFFLSTNETKNMEEKENLINNFKPKKIIFSEDKTDKIGYKFNVLNRKHRLLLGLNQILESKENYDLILITRFDLTFIKKLIDLNIDISKFNCVNKYDDELIDDNFYIFPYSFLNTFYEIIFENTKIMHRIKNKLIENFGELNYLSNSNIFGGEFYILNKERNN